MWHAFAKTNLGNVDRPHTLLLNMHFIYLCQYMVPRTLDDNPQHQFWDFGEDLNYSTKSQCSVVFRASSRLTNDATQSPYLTLLAWFLCPISN